MLLQEKNLLKLVGLINSCLFSAWGRGWGGILSSCVVQLVVLFFWKVTK